MGDFLVRCLGFLLYTYGRNRQSVGFLMIPIRNPSPPRSYRRKKTRKCRRSVKYFLKPSFPGCFFLRSYPHKSLIRDHFLYNKSYGDLWEDADGQYFLNYLNSYVKDESGLFNWAYAEHRKAIEGKLIKYKGIPQIWSKYMWAARHNNYFCDTYPDLLGDDLRVDIEKFRGPISSIIEK